MTRQEDIIESMLKSRLMDFMDYLIDDPVAFMLAKNGGSVSEKLHIQEVQWENFKKDQVAKYFLHKTFGGERVTNPAAAQFNIDLGES